MSGHEHHPPSIELVAQARAEHPASTIVERWRERFKLSPGSVDRDFIELAAGVLWERLLPERPSFEMLDERMQAGYAAFSTAVLRGP